MFESPNQQESSFTFSTQPIQSSSPQYLAQSFSFSNASRSNGKHSKPQPHQGEQTSYSISTVPCELRSPSPFTPLPSSSGSTKSLWGRKFSERDGSGERARRGSHGECSPSSNRTPDPLRRSQGDSSPRLIQVGTDGRTFQFVSGKEAGSHRTSELLGKEKAQFQSPRDSDRSSHTEMDSVVSCKAYAPFGTNSRRFLDDGRDRQDGSTSLFEVATEAIRSEAARQGLAQGLDEEEQRIFVFDGYGKLQMKSRTTSRSSSRSQHNSSSSSSFIPADKSLKMLKMLQGNASEEAIIIGPPHQESEVQKPSRSHSPRMKVERMDTEKPRRRMAISRVEMQNWVDGVKGESDPNPEPCHASEGSAVDCNHLEEALLSVESTLRDLSMAPSPEDSVDAEALNEAHLFTHNGNEEVVGQPISRTSHSTLSLGDSNVLSTAPTTVASADSNPKGGNYESSELSARKFRIMESHKNFPEAPPLNRSDSASESCVSSSQLKSSSPEAPELLPPSLNHQNRGLNNVKVSDFNPNAAINSSSQTSSSSLKEDIKVHQQEQGKGITDLETKAEMLEQVSS